MPKKSSADRSISGPVPTRLKIGGSWQDAIKTSLTKKKPPEGWPKDSEQKKSSR